MSRHEVKELIRSRSVTALRQGTYSLPAAGAERSGQPSKVALGGPRADDHNPQFGDRCEPKRRKQMMHAFRGDELADVANGWRSGGARSPRREPVCVATGVDDRCTVAEARY